MGTRVWGTEDSAVSRSSGDRKVTGALICRAIGFFGACALLAVTSSTSAIASGAVKSTASATVMQVGTYDYLASPNYDGLVDVGQVSRGLTLGLGTFDHLDGELILVGGHVYRVGTDGIPVLVTGHVSTPFFEGITFIPTRSVPVPPGTTCAQLPALVHQVAHTPAAMTAVRVRGTFTDVVMRSESAQTKPYPALAAVLANQSVFPLGQRQAVLVGFWSGAGLGGIGAPGLHLHGVTTDLRAGGHVLSCVAGDDVQLSVEPVRAVKVLAE